MQNTTYILSNPILLLFIAFIVAISYASVFIEMRHYEVIHFNRLNYAAFHIAVRLNPEYDLNTISLLFQLFNDNYPNYFTLYFSTKPLIREAWFSPDELQYFFNYKTVKS